jgi:RNA polymerase sigma-70 factor (ECF subfamily)
MSMSALVDLGGLLRQVFTADDTAALPSPFADLLARLELSSSQAPGSGVADPEFKRQLTALVPAMRSYGRSLTRCTDMADDLAQETILKAWMARERFVAGTNLKAWCFTILRNVYLSQLRRKRFTGEWDERVAERKLVAAADQDQRIHIEDAERALARIPRSQREALILVGAQDLTYEEAAEVSKVPVGTVKSRVARGRQALTRELYGADEALLA